MGFALALADRRDEAQAEFRRALSIDPNLKAAREGLAGLEALAANRPAGSSSPAVSLSVGAATTAAYEEPVPRPLGPTAEIRVNDGRIRRWAIWVTRPEARGFDEAIRCQITTRPCGRNPSLSKLRIFGPEFWPKATFTVAWGAAPGTSGNLGCLAEGHIHTNGRQTDLPC